VGSAILGRFKNAAVIMNFYLDYCFFPVDGRTYRCTPNKTRGQCRRIFQKFFLYTLTFKGIGPSVENQQRMGGVILYSLGMIAERGVCHEQ
jgi:hypothetical protein